MQSRNRFYTCRSSDNRIVGLIFSFAAFIPWCAVVGAQGFGESRAYASWGGYAESRAFGEGNTDVRSFSSATNGGRASSTAEGHSRHGGASDVTSIAMSDGGFAESSAFGDARGRGSYANSKSTAGSIRGRAIARDEAIARGQGTAQSLTSAFTFEGEANARGRSSAAGYGGRATSRNYTQSESYRGDSHAASLSDSIATSGGDALSDGAAISIAGPGRSTHARFHANSEAHEGGRSMAGGEFRDTRFDW